ncbi:MULTISPECIES: hypothetical protein [unclassified Bosea (in: a-proteobacteria)]|uniref:hypothetical protein n=1 Tax=unclassified Bosea (in: a-proteobacteria) TaxID=2653178 RepID=UPI000C312E8B
MSARVVILCTLAVALGGGAQALDIDSLRGHSIVISYRERLIGRMGPIGFFWNDRVYISEASRIFHRADVRSTVPGRGGGRESVGDGQGGTSQLAWNGSALTRSWVNGIGVQVTQTIEVFPQAGGFGCRMRVGRDGPVPPVEVLSESCRVIRGNVFAGRGR